jgi:DNA-binding transcriptional MerR regulator
LYARSVIDHHYLTIKQVTKRTGLSGYTLRYYEQMGIIREIRRSGGRRVFAAADMEWLIMLSILRSTGMPIKNLKELANLKYAGQQTIAQRIIFFETYRRSLEKQITTYKHAVDIIQHKIDYHKKQLES